jgi:hypothetical protein
MGVAVALGVAAPMAASGVTSLASPAYADEKAAAASINVPATAVEGTSITLSGKNWLNPKPNSKGWNGISVAFKLDGGNVWRTGAIDYNGDQLDVQRGSSGKVTDKGGPGELTRGSVWGAVKADEETGDWSIDLPLPNDENATSSDLQDGRTDTPISENWKIGTHHSVQILSGSIVSGDTAQPVSPNVFSFDITGEDGVIVTPEPTETEPVEPFSGEFSWDVLSVDPVDGVDMKLSVKNFKNVPKNNVGKNPPWIIAYLVPKGTKYLAGNLKLEYIYPKKEDDSDSRWDFESAVPFTLYPEDLSKDVEYEIVFESANGLAENPVIFYRTPFALTAEQRAILWPEEETPEPSESAATDEPSDEPTSEPSEPEETESAEPEETESSEPEETESSDPEESESSEPSDTESAEPEETESSQPEETESSEPEETTPAESPEPTTEPAGEPSDEATDEATDDGADPADEPSKGTDESSEGADEPSTGADEPTNGEDEPSAGAGAPEDDSSDVAEDAEDAASTGDDDSTGNGSDNSGKLPRTGIELTAAGIGLALLLVGAVTVVISRRKRQ